MDKDIAIRHAKKFYKWRFTLDSAVLWQFFVIRIIPTEWVQSRYTVLISSIEKN